MNEKINLIKELNEKEKKEKNDRISMINLLNAQQTNEKLVSSPPLPSPPPPFQFSRSSDHYSIQSSQFSIENVTASSSEKQSETSSISIFSDDQQFPKEDSKSPVWRRNLFLVADEDGADICEWRFNIKEEALQKDKKMEQGGGGQQPWRGIETPTGQPTKSCLKQTPQTSSSPKQQIGNSSYSLHHVGTEPDGESWEDRGEISFDLDKQRLALIQQMQKNLEIHRKHQSPRRYPTVPFDGPFFRLEEVGNNIPGTSTSGGNIPAPPPPPPQGWTPRQSSSQIYEQQSPSNNPEEEEFDEASGGRVVYWPAPDPKSRLPKQAPPPPKNLRDPERLEEFLRQEQMQKEAEALRMQREAELRDRQFRALQLQQQQQNHVRVPSTSTSNYFPSPPSHPLPDYDDYQQQQNQKNVRVFETRPISAEESLASPEFATNGQSNRGTWRRTFTLDSRLSRGLTIDERNEILTSDERLIRERFNIDLLKRRESFIEKPEHPPEIQRLGRRWQPPLEQPYKWPTSSPSTQQPLSVQTGGDAEEYRWAPLIREPTFKKETKRFTPEPESPPIRGHGTGPLDDVAKRQTANLILPSPDGSHRPRTEFSHIRKPPAGGFMPHAPNVIRVSRAEGKAQKAETGGGLRRHTSDIRSKEPIEREYLTHNNEDMNGGASSSQYQYNRQLPRHSSTIVQLGPLPRVEVRRRIKLLEARQQQTNHQRSRSAVSHARSGSSAARSPSAQRSLERIQRATAPSPAPASYARARRYVPTALPSGIRQNSDQMSQERPQIPPRHTRQMAEVVQNTAKSHKQIHEPLCAKFVPNTFSAQKQKLEGNGRGIFNEKSQKKIIPPQEEKGRKQLILNDERGGERSQILPSSTDSGEIQSYHSERTVEHRRYTSRS
uniref:Uncharacterized protein n=1 Tax=Meloidogyne incognita TaxID=6306 RepID=A0A914MV30_MELIC